MIAWLRSPRGRATLLVVSPAAQGSQNRRSIQAMLAPLPAGRQLQQVVLRSLPALTQEERREMIKALEGWPGSCALALP